MAKIKCSYVTCKYNNATLTKRENGFWDSDVELGECNCQDEIRLINYECDECGYDGEGVVCENFDFKSQLKK